MADNEKAILAGGCFWGVQDLIRMRAVVAICRVRHIAAGVADPRAHNPVELADQILYAPKAPTRKDRLLVEIGRAHV